MDVFVWVDTERENEKKQNWMSAVYLKAMLSRDASTKIGAIIVGPNEETRSSGYNGMPRGVDDDNEWRHERPQKYFYFEHAERNAIYNAARVGIPTDGCTMYTQGTPCADCARAIIQAGIKKVVVHKRFDDFNSKKWSESAGYTQEMFNESGVELEVWDGDILEIAGLHSGQEIGRSEDE